MASLSSQPSKKGIRTNAGTSSNQGKPNPPGQTVKFARRTSSGRYVNLSSENLDLSGELNYSVQTPDNQPMEKTTPTKAEEQYVSSSLFTGGFNSVTRAHMMDKVIDSNVNHPQMKGSKGSSCAMPACDGKVMKDERGNDIIPCECRFKICRDCLMDAQKDSGLCPGCKEPYRGADFDEDDYSRETLSLPVLGGSKRSRGYDHDDMYGGGQRSLLGDDRPWRPLSRRIPISRKIILPYRLLIVLRLIALGFFFQWRIRHPNIDAVWLWYMSVICELWFGLSWILDQIPKLTPINRSTNLEALRERFEMLSPSNPTSDLPGVDLFVSTFNPDIEDPLVTANTILSILAVDYPVEKMACYVSDDGAALLTFEAMAEAASFADLWVPFCRKHEIEPRNPESYFSLRGDPTKFKSRIDFVKDRRRVKREYDEFKVRINGLPDSIRRRSDAFNAREEMKALKQMREKVGGDITEMEPVKPQKATWMADGSHWPGAWTIGAAQHSKGDHEAILQVMLKPPSHDPLMGSAENALDFTDVDIRLPMFVYVSRERRPGYDHNDKAGAMNALVRSSAVLSNGPFILNLDCDHYIYNSQVIREGMCFMMDKGGEDISYIQFPQRFEGVDPSDRYANHNNVFYDGNMRALDGIQGPVYVGTGCIFRRFALYGFDPPKVSNILTQKKIEVETEKLSITNFDPQLDNHLLPKRFGNSEKLVQSIMVAELQARPIADHKSVKYGRPPGALRAPRHPLDSATVIEAVSVISCWYEDKTAWGEKVGWIYGSTREDLVTGYCMHNRGWRSVYCLTKRDAFRGSAPINLTDRLHQVLRWATGSIEIYFSRHNPLIGSRHLKLLQRVAYLNVCTYPFSSIFLLVYCFLPALSLFAGQFIVQRINVALLVYCLVIFMCIIGMAVLEVKWSGVELEQWWRNEQFWVISGTSSHLAAMVQGVFKGIAGIQITPTKTFKPVSDDDDEKYADLYVVKWTGLMILPIVIAMVNVIAMVVALAKIIYSSNPKWSKLIGGYFFAFWVLAHLYPFTKGLMGRRRRTPTLVFVWAGLITITLSLLWIAISPPISDEETEPIISNTFEFP